MSAVAPARVVAFTVLRRVFEDGAYADRVLRGASERLDDRDRALARRLAAYAASQRDMALAFPDFPGQAHRACDVQLQAIGRQHAYGAAACAGRLDDGFQKTIQQRLEFRAV